MGTTGTRTVYEVRLKARQEVAEGTMAFQFEKPLGFTFKAGQYVEVTLINPKETDAQGDSRTFSIASAPHEDFLMVAIRMRDTAFKHVLGTLGVGSTAHVEGPFGNLILHNNPARAAILLAGGIGITPFRSIIMRAAKEKLPHQLFLFYSNRRPEDAPFLKELRDIEAQNPNYKFIGTMTDLGKSRQSWTGETGYMTRDMLSRYSGDAVSPVYYIAGPPAMVIDFREMLTRSGVDGDDIRTEEFAGY
ncbi:MAG: FAD-dependent oxidoreductase [Bryobacteraceae bacterium]